MRITLDRLALRELIDSDPQFELELKSAVMSEIGRRFFKKDSARVIAAAEPELFSKLIEAMQKDSEFTEQVQTSLREMITQHKNGFFSKRKIAAPTQEAIDDYVQEARSRIIYDAQAKISTAYNDAIQKAVDEKLASTDMDELIEKRVSRLVEREINERADEKFKQRMADLKEMMS